MKKQYLAGALGLLLLQGCATAQRGAVPVVDAGAPVSEASGRLAARAAAPAVSPAAAPAALPADSGVVVMVPQGSSAPLETFAAPPGVPRSSAPAPAPSGGAAWGAPVAPLASPPAPTGIPSSGGGLAADEQLDGPVLALLTTAQQQQSSGDLGSAASSLERAQRIAPREPQVLYRLAQVRLSQGDAVQAEQLSRRALGYAGDRPALQAELWELIAQARERQGDPTGAQQARARARVNL